VSIEAARHRGTFGFAISGPAPEPPTPQPVLAEQQVNGGPGKGKDQDDCQPGQGDSNRQSRPEDGVMLPQVLPMLAVAAEPFDAPEYSSGVIPARWRISSGWVQSLSRVVSYLAGLDLGQASDFTALAILERTRPAERSDSWGETPFCWGIFVRGIALIKIHFS
jgi:hypothetical protein